MCTFATNDWTQSKSIKPCLNLDECYKIEIGLGFV